jgi:hypothetical protein
LKIAGDGEIDRAVVPSIDAPSLASDDVDDGLGVDVRIVAGCVLAATPE